MLKPVLALWALTLVSSAAIAAENCEALRLQIEANIAAKGITGFTVRTVDAASTDPGQVVGQCGNGSKKILYARGAAVTASQASASPPAVSVPAAPPQRNSVRTTRDEDILTECRDGSVSVGGRCKD